MSPLAAALDEVAAALCRAHDPWWVIGSAAAWLHGARTPVADIDVLLSPRDARAVMVAWRGELEVGLPGERFRSSPFVRLNGAPLAIELMAELHVRPASEWLPVRPVTRQRIGKLYVPEPAELGAMFDLFARPKDRERAELMRVVAARRSPSSGEERADGRRSTEVSV